MTKPVTLSNSAFAALRKDKKKGESDSDVVMRLLETANGQKKDPWLLTKIPLRRAMTFDEQRKMIEESREADRRDAWDEAEKRNRKGGKRPARP